MKRLYFLGGFLSTLLMTCFLMLTPVSAQYNGSLLFGNDPDDEPAGITLEQIQRDEAYQSNCHLALCSEEPVDEQTLRVCREWAELAFGRSDCAYVNAAVNVEYRCVDEYRCLPDPNQTNLSRELRLACDAVLDEIYNTNDCPLLPPSILSDVFARLSEEDKFEALEIENPSPEATTCVQTMCSHQSGSPVRARDLRICQGWADLRLGTTSCSELRRVVDDGSLESRSYQMTEQDEFTCVAALCGEPFIQMSRADEMFCQDWANLFYGTNQCEALLEAWAPEESTDLYDPDYVYDPRENFFPNISYNWKLRAYGSWKAAQINEGNNTPDRLTFEEEMAEAHISALRDRGQLHQCLPILLGQDPEQRIPVATCRYLAEEYGFYQTPTQSQINQCQIILASNQEDENSDIERVRCQYWLERQQSGENNLTPNASIVPPAQNANVDVDTPELFFEDVSFSNGVYTVAVGNSGFVPETPLPVVLSARWIHQEDGWQNHRQDFVAIRFMEQPRAERQWLFEIPAERLSQNFPPEHAGYLEFSIDPSNQIAERNENNNGWASAPRPDFRVLDIGNTEIIRTGIIPIVIANSAPRSQFEQSVPFLFQWINHSGNVVNSFEDMAFMVARNQRYQAELAVREIPDGAVGFKVTANHKQIIPEMSYTNNVYQYSFAPDFVIDSVITKQESLVVRVQNIGNINIPFADFEVQSIWLSAQGLPIGSTVQNLTQRDDEQQWTLRWPLAQIPKNAVAVKFVADAERLVAETNESNNIALYALSESGIIVAQNENTNESLNPVEDNGPTILPGDALYGIKQAWRSLRLGMTLNPTKKAEYLLELAEIKQTERLKIIRQGQEIPKDAPKILDIDKFVSIIKNIPDTKTDEKHNFLKKSIAHIEFEYEIGVGEKKPNSFEDTTQPTDGDVIVYEYKPQPTDGDVIVYEYEPQPTDGDVIVYEYEPQPIDGDVIVYEYKPLVEFSRDFLKILGASNSQRDQRDLLSTMTKEKYGSAQKHLQTAIKIASLEKIAPTEIYPLIIEKKEILVKKITESFDQETPHQQKVFVDTIGMNEKSLSSAKNIFENLKKETTNETAKATIIIPKIQQIDTNISAYRPTPETSKTTVTTSSTVVQEATTPECNDDKLIVCGKDGNTYTSKCAAKKAGIIVVSLGQCPTFVPPKIPDTTTIVKPTSTITVEPIPVIDCTKQATVSVCGDNGKTYSNSCYAEKDGVKVVSNGACPIKTVTPPPECTSNLNCEDKNSCTANACVNGKCVYTKYNSCGTSEYSCTDGIDNDRNGQVDCKDNACSSLSFCAPAPTCDDSEPVCGRDGVTYTSECAAKAKGVIVDAYGRCPTAPLTTLNTNTQTNTTINTNTTISTQKRFTISGGKFESNSVSLSLSQTLLIQNLDTKEYTFGGGTIQGTIAAKGSKTVTFPSIGQYNTYLHENPSDVIMITVTK